MPQLGVG